MNTFIPSFSNVMHTSIYVILCECRFDWTRSLDRVTISRQGCLASGQEFDGSGLVTEPQYPNHEFASYIDASEAKSILYDRRSFFSDVTHSLQSCSFLYGSVVVPVKQLFLLVTLLSIHHRRKF